MILPEPLPTPVYFASDVHWPLKREYPQGKPFLDFLDSLTEGSLILAGDVFDFWFEWKSVAPAYWFELFYRLRKLRERGIRTWFVCGNHDFHFGPYLEREVGLIVSPDDLEFEAGGRRFFVAHGDGLARQDRGYRLLKKIIRNPFSIWMYAHLVHPDWGIALARWTSGTSRKHRRIDTQAWAEEYFAYARSRLDGGFDHVVLGHLHHAELRQVGDKSYLNCGDWIDQFSYGRFDEGRLELCRWSAQRSGASGG